MSSAHRSVRWIVAFGLAVIAMLPLSLSARPAVAGSGPPPVQVMTGSGGQYLADVNGMTLYVFSADQANSGGSACADACAAAWPPVTLMFGGVAIPPVGLMGTLATITRQDGSQQVTYNGLPLYRFVRDTSAGQMSGQGATAFGGTWTVATP